MTDSYSDSNPNIFAEKFQLHPMALTKLTGLPNKVVQNAYYDGDECFKMYATQTGSGSDRFSSRVYRSTNDPMIDYLPMDGNFVKSGKATFDSKPLMVLDNSFARIAGHTQTLIDDGYLMLTGINDLNFTNLLKLLHKKYGASVPISKWVKDIDNPSTKAFRRIASTSDLVTGNIYHKPLAGQDSGANYWTTRIGAFRFNDSADDNTQMIKLGKYNILTGFDVALKNSFRESSDELNFIKSHDLYRIEASVDRSHNNILFAIQVGQEEKYSRVYVLVYDYGTISGKLVENLSDINMQQGLYYNDDNTNIHKVPDADLPLSDTEIDQALDWYHECLKIDDFAIDISQYNDVAHSCIHTDNLVMMRRKPPHFNEGI